jgi:hypothetical protein
VLETLLAPPQWSQLCFDLATTDIERVRDFLHHAGPDRVSGLRRCPAVARSPVATQRRAARPALSRQHA